MHRLISILSSLSSVTKGIIKNKISHKAKHAIAKITNNKIKTGFSSKILYIFLHSPKRYRTTLVFSQRFKQPFKMPYSLLSPIDFIISARMFYFVIYIFQFDKKLPHKNTPEN